jgi:hypothetical protein
MNADFILQSESDGTSSLQISIKHVAISVEDELHKGNRRDKSKIKIKNEKEIGYGHSGYFILICKNSQQ